MEVGVGGETMSHHLGRRMEQCKNNENKIHGGINRPPIGRPKHNNQPKTGSCNGGEQRGDMRRARHMKEAQCHHLGGIVNWIGGKKIKEIVEFGN